MVYKYLINGISFPLQSHSVFAVLAVIGGLANKLLRDSAFSKEGTVIQKKMEKRREAERRILGLHNIAFLYYRMLMILCSALSALFSNH